MEEIWKDVPNYDGVYKASNYGRLMSCRNGKVKILKGSITKKGYIQYTLNYASKGLYNVFGGHQLVAITFLDHVPNGINGYVVDHIDNNRLNNYVGNLQLISNRENTIKNKSVTSLYGVKKYFSRYQSRVWHNKKSVYLGTYDTEEEASNAAFMYMKANNINRII